tara:strand:+ start:25 stop:198 length:174 start_codon:yes stop_codon:yes gene_type:complete
MKCEVKCYVAGKVFTVECYAANYNDARKVALAQYPNARIMGVMQNLLNTMPVKLVSH